jgi:hypothetical protein
MSTDKNQPTVVEDFLDEDTEIPGQRYVLLSFLSPEKVLAKKDQFFFKKFLENYEVDWKIKNLEKFMVDTVKHINDELDERARELEKNDQFDQAAICRKNRLSIDDVMGKYNNFVQKSRNDVTKTKIAEAFDDFLYKNKTKLESEFHAQNDFQTTIRGLKVRGVYGNPKEAELKAKKLQNKDKYHNILVGDVGKWLPWDPEPHEVTDQEYAQDELNTLMRKYKENEDNREKFFEERKKGGGAGAKQVMGVSTEGGQSSATDSFGSMFSAQGDLAIQRKMEQKQPAVTIEKVEDVEEEKSAPQNTIVEPTN